MLSPLSEFQINVDFDPSLVKAEAEEGLGERHNLLEILTEWKTAGLSKLNSLWASSSLLDFAENDDEAVKALEQMVDEFIVVPDGHLM